jgi:hypothetical protein
VYLNAFCERICLLTESAEAYWPNDDATESISTHTAKAKESLFLFNKIRPRADHDLRHAERIAIAEKSNTTRPPVKR